VTTRPFPPPWTIEEPEACFVVIDSAGQKLAYVCFEEEPWAAMRQENVIKKHFRKLMHSP
jgi:hypothetical protein